MRVERIGDATRYLVRFETATGTDSICVCARNAKDAERQGREELSALSPRRLVDCYRVPTLNETIAQQQATETAEPAPKEKPADLFQSLASERRAS